MGKMSLKRCSAKDLPNAALQPFAWDAVVCISLSALGPSAPTLRGCQGIAVILAPNALRSSQPCACEFQASPCLVGGVSCGKPLLLSRVAFFLLSLGSFLFIPLY